MKARFSPVRSREGAKVVHVYVVDTAGNDVRYPPIRFTIIKPKGKPGWFVRRDVYKAPYRALDLPTYAPVTTLKGVDEFLVQNVSLVKAKEAVRAAVAEMKEETVVDKAKHRAVIEKAIDHLLVAGKSKEDKARTVRCDRCGKVIAKNKTPEAARGLVKMHMKDKHGADRTMSSD